MQNLDTYAKNRLINNLKYKLPNVNGYRTFDEFCDINNFVNDISEEAIDFYYKYNINSSINRYHIDYINLITENLKSYETQKLVDKLNKEFTNEINSIHKFGSSDNDSFFPIEIKLSYKNNLIDTTCNTENNELLKNDISKKFKDILTFYGHYITVIDKQMGIYYIYVEPKFTKDILADCRNNGGYLYHITAKDNEENIKKKGLIPKTGKTPDKGGYRYFPERVYMICPDKNFKKDKRKLINDIKTIIADKKLDNNYIILKINIKSHNIPIYKDSAYSDSNNIYTYEAIPKQLITIINNINDL